MEKERKILLIICILGGWFGLHHFINGKIGKGILYLFTFGLFGIGWIIDIISIIFKKEIPSINDTCINDAWLKKNGITITSHSVTGVNPYANAVPYSIYENAYTDRKQKGTPKDYVVFDTETTGLEPGIDRIIELSAIKYINNKKVETFNYLVNPKTQIDPFITKLTGITQNDLIGQPTINQVLPKFYSFIENYTLVAHNAPFDIKMLACECYRSDIELCDNKIIDTVTLAKRVIPKERIDNYKLETLKKYLGLTFNSHRASDDCETCAKVYQLYLASQNKNKIIMIDEKTGEVLEEIN